MDRRIGVGDEAARDFHVAKPPMPVAAPDMTGARMPAPNSIEGLRQFGLVDQGETTDAARTVVFPGGQERMISTRRVVIREGDTVQTAYYPPPRVLNQLAGRRQA